MMISRLRLIVNQLLPDEPGTKVNQCVDNIMQIWRDGEADKLTQLVFCDISTPQAIAATSKTAKTLDNPLLYALEEVVRFMMTLGKSSSPRECLRLRLLSSMRQIQK